MKGNLIGAAFWTDENSEVSVVTATNEVEAMSSDIRSGSTLNALLTIGLCM